MYVYVSCGPVSMMMIGDQVLLLLFQRTLSVTCVAWRWPDGN